MFAVTNIDDLLILAVFFGRAGRDRRAEWRIVAGQYLGFLGILAVSVAGGLGAGLLPAKVIPYLGLLPLAIGLKAGWQVWRDRDKPDSDEEPAATAPGPLQVAAVTFANGGDNIGVYVPVFAVAGVAGMVGYASVFLVGVAVWCGAGWFLATRAPVAAALARWGHLILPVVLVAIGLLILAGGF
ncbi:cadmium resistance transporter [Actinoplanes sp. NPDC026619]|uniref:cadmium resistance transporter n=1 Tax=Actinoplanes sp. NPDC026619 TaxID=3155798 RepID=UPI0033DBDCC9